jgi:OCT family organic cation transporter-like MFS transporter 4/5
MKDSLTFASLIGMELVGGKWRTISGVSYLFPVPLSYIAIAGIAYFVRGWSQLQLAITLPSVLLFALWW